MGREMAHQVDVVNGNNRRMRLNKAGRFADLMQARISVDVPERREPFDIGKSPAGGCRPFFLEAEYGTNTGNQKACNRLSKK